MKRSLILLGLLVPASFIITGCETNTSTARSSAAAAGLQKSADEIVEGQAKMDELLTALNDLVNNPTGDLKAKFKPIAAAVDKLESIGLNIGKVAEDMNAKGKAYFDNWNIELAKIQNEDVRERSAERKSEVERNFAGVQEKYQQVRDRFRPFMTSLKDVRTYLATDLTPGGIASVKDLVKQVNKDAGPLRASVNELVEEFRKVGLSMSSMVPIPTPEPAN